MRSPVLSHSVQPQMIVKFIKVFVKPGRLKEYLAAQEVWNREMHGATGFLGSFCGRCGDELDDLYLLLFWRSRDDLDHWMRTEHNRIAALAAADEHYERIEVRVLDAALTPDMHFPDA